MKACQNVIVTLTIGDEQLDVELPAFLPVAEVNARVLEMLRALYPQVYGSCTAIRLYDQGAPIAESRTLASCGDLGRRKPAGPRYIGVICCF